MSKLLAISTKKTLNFDTDYKFTVGYILSRNIILLPIGTLR